VAAVTRCVFGITSTRQGHRARTCAGRTAPACDAGTPFISSPLRTRRPSFIEYFAIDLIMEEGVCRGVWRSI